MSKIFISYRREDSAYVSDSLSYKLIEFFGPESVFFDRDNIPLGVDFREFIARAIKESSVVLVIIGNSWLHATSDDGNRRLDNPTDLVRIEIELALSQNIPVVPVLVGNAQIPSSQDLPKPISELAYRNAVEIRSGPDTIHHTKLLIDKLIPIIPERQEKVSQVEYSSDDMTDIADVALTNRRLPDLCPCGSGQHRILCHCGVNYVR